MIDTNTIEIPIFIIQNRVIVWTDFGLFYTTELGYLYIWNFNVSLAFYQILGLHL